MIPPRSLPHRKEEITPMTTPEPCEAAKAAANEIGEYIVALLGNAQHIHADLFATADIESIIQRYANAECDLLGDALEALKSCVAMLEHVDLCDGVCMCGGAMKDHTGYEGHPATDMGYHLGTATIDKARAILARAKEKP